MMLVIPLVQPTPQTVILLTNCRDLFLFCGINVLHCPYIIGHWMVLTICISIVSQEVLGCQHFLTNGEHLGRLARREERNRA
jgi:hypothetical protein